VFQVLIQTGALTGCALQRLATQLKAVLQVLHSIHILHLDLKQTGQHSVGPGMPRRLHA
jgi:serine/threonine protein kinase